jgi:DNA-directed RNA polymerase beta subunit
MISSQDIQQIVHHYFQKQNVLIDHQTSSYDNLIDEIVPNILNQIFPITVNQFNETIHTIQLQLDKLTTQHPTYVENNGSSQLMTPQIARLRNDTYSLSILLDLRVVIKIVENEQIVEIPPKMIRQVFLGKIPIVVKSKYCVTKHIACDECKFDTGKNSVQSDHGVCESKTK